MKNEPQEQQEQMMPRKGEDKKMTENERLGLTDEHMARVNAKLRDPWQHRSEHMKCSTCMWYVKKACAEIEGVDKVKVSQVGRCRKHAPTLGGYPVVFDSDFCGDHKLDENKVKK